jgi:hypothetical protein
VGDFVDAAQDFVDNVLPLVARQRSAYAKREAAAAAKLPGGVRGAAAR